METVSAKELTYWNAYHVLEPWGEERADLRSGTLTAMLANVNRRKRSDKVYKPSDFMPDYLGIRNVLNPIALVAKLEVLKNRITKR